MDYWEELQAYGVPPPRRNLATRIQEGLQSLGLPIKIGGASEPRQVSASDLKALSELRDRDRQHWQGLHDEFTAQGGSTEDFFGRYPDAYKIITGLPEQATIKGRHVEGLDLPATSVGGGTVGGIQLPSAGVLPAIKTGGYDESRLFLPRSARQRYQETTAGETDPRRLYTAGVSEGFVKAAPPAGYGTIEETRGKLGADTEAASALAALRRGPQWQSEEALAGTRRADEAFTLGPKWRSEEALGGQRGQAARLNAVRAGLLPGESASLVNQRNAAAELNRVNAGLAPARAVPGSLPLTPGSQNAYKELVRDYPPGQTEKIDEADYRAISKHARGLGFEPIWTRMGNKGGPYTYYLKGYEVKGGAPATTPALPQRTPGAGKTKQRKPLNQIF